MTISVDLELCERYASRVLGFHIMSTAEGHRLRDQLRALLLERQTQAEVLMELVRVERLDRKAWISPDEQRALYRDKPAAMEAAFALVDALPPRVGVGEKG